MAIMNFSGAYGNHLKLEVLSGTVSQSVSGNSSVIRIWCNLISDSYASVYGVTAPLTVYVNGTGAIEQVTVNISPNSKQLLWVKEYTVPHNSDGTKTVPLSLKVDINAAGYGSAEYRWDYQLATIPRASPISASNGALGSAMTLTIDRKSSSFTHTVRYNWQGATGTVGTGVGTSASYTPPLTFASNIPNSTSGTITFYCDTYSGSTLVGTSQTTVTLTIPDSVVPTIDGLTLEDTATAMNGISTSTEFAQILSRVKATVIGASGVYGSTIKSYSITVVDQNLTLNTNGGVFDYFKNNGTFIVRATVTDSRGRTSANKDVTINVKEYFSPVGGLSAVRSGTNKDKLTVTRNAKVAPLNIGGVNKNTLSIQFKYSQRGSGTWTDSTGDANENLTSTFELVNSQASLVETFSTTKSYDLIMVVSDKFLSSEVKVSVGTVTIPYAVTKNAFGIGKAPEITNSVDSAYQYYYNGNPIQHYKFTNNDGTTILLSDGADLNSVTEPGLYSGNNLLHAQSTGWNYIRVNRHDVDAGYVLQEAIDFNGVVSAFRVQSDGIWKDWQYYAVQNSIANFTAVNQTKVYTTSITLPGGLVATASRIGNLVTLTLNRDSKTLPVCEYTAQNNTIPSGYRPTSMAHFSILANSGSTVSGTGIIHISTDGTIRLTNGIGDAKVWIGTITYLTSDPFPAE
jgi:hypothetical protein